MYLDYYVRTKTSNYPAARTMLQVNVKNVISIELCVCPFPSDYIPITDMIFLLLVYELFIIV